MGDSAVPLGDDEIRRIGDYVKPYLREMVLELVPAATGQTQVLERLGRVEEGIKQNGDHLVRLESELLSQRKLMDDRFVLTEKRFDDVSLRFDDVNHRFGDMQESFRRTQWLIGIGFVMVTAVVTVFGLMA